MTANSQTDEQLVDLLDDALSEIRLSKTVDCEYWQQTHPEASEEEVTLVQTLMLLSSAADSWRDSDVQDLGVTTEPRNNAGPVIPSMIGRYCIRGLVGSGAMGDVFDGYDPQLDRRVAVKVPRCERLVQNRTGFVERFIREARAAAAVRHENICPVYDTGKHLDQPYVVMAYVDGESLEGLLSRGKISEVELAVDFASQVAEALEAIHQHGIIHRDLKPGNILIDRTGHALLTDFGLAVSTGAVERLTSDGSIVGTPVYMSPEQAAGENSTLTPSSDIYSLGAVLYEMLTGAVPFRAPLIELLKLIQTEKAVPVTSLRPDVDPELSGIVDRAMAKLPAERFGSAAEMARALQGWAAGQAMSSTFVEPLERRAVVSVPQVKAVNWLRAYRVHAIGLSAALLVAAGLGNYALSGRVLRKTVATEQPAISNSLDRLPDTKMPALDALKGDVEITVSSDPDKPAGRGLIKKSLLVSRNDSGAVPLQPGDLIHFHVTLKRPAYVYLIWIDSEGQTTPLYPWDAVRSTASWNAPLLNVRKIDDLHFPPDLNVGLPVEGTPGMQHVVLLARTEPLESPGAFFQNALKNLPPTPISNNREVAYLEWSPLDGSQFLLRGIGSGKPKAFDAPVLNQLKERLQDKFELIKVWRFAQIEE